MEVMTVRGGPTSTSVLIRKATWSTAGIVGQPGRTGEELAVAAGAQAGALGHQGHICTSVSVPETRAGASLRARCTAGRKEPPHKARQLRAPPRISRAIGTAEGGGPRTQSGRQAQEAQKDNTTRLGLREESGTGLFTVLLEKLIQIGLRVSTPRRPETWRKGRKQSALINDRVLSCEDASGGRPGDPVLFNIFISDLEGAVNGTLIKFPDETKFGGAAESQ